MYGKYHNTHFPSMSDRSRADLLPSIARAMMARTKLAISRGLTRRLKKAALMLDRAAKAVPRAPRPAAAPPRPAAVPPRAAERSTGAVRLRLRLLKKPPMLPRPRRSWLKGSTVPMAMEVVLKV